MDGITNPRSILVLRQKDDLPVRVAGEYVVGPLGSVQWRELENNAIRIIRAITSTLAIPTETLFIEEFSGLSSPFSPVGLSISASPGAAGDALLERANEVRAIAQTYQKEIQKSARMGQESLLNSPAALNSEVEWRLKERVQNDLTVIGGKHIRRPMVLETGPDDKLILSGRFGPRPPVQRKPPVMIKIVGTIAGIRTYHKLIEILVNECKVEEFGCDPNKFAHKLREAVYTPRRFEFSILVTTDAKGKMQRELFHPHEIEPLNVMQNKLL